VDNSKICKICELPRPLDSFRVSNKTGKPLNPCLECRRERKRKEREYNVERDNATKDAWAKRNPGKVAASKKKWKSDNIGRVKADRAQRKQRIAQATPKWLSSLQKEAIDFYYMMAHLRTTTTGTEYHVDHIVPLKGKNVCGLNVPWNLETIPAKENLKNGNKMFPWRAEHRG
jgi:hypothetical protein